MKLILKRLPSSLRGIYPDKQGRKDALGAHQLLAHPDLYDAIMRMESDGVRLIYSDIYRSAESSLRRRREFQAAMVAYDAKVKADPAYAKTHARPKQLAKPAGYSPHGQGVAVDLDIKAILKERHCDKKALDWLLEGYGLYCHRKDHVLDNEAWHYNCLGPNAAQWLPASAARPSTSYAIEAKVMSLYGSQFVLKESEIRAYLVTLGHLPIGRELSEGVKEFQRLWDLDVDRKAGPKTQRTLAAVCAEQEIV
jgi:hypothetical protein